MSYKEPPRPGNKFYAGMLVATIVGSWMWWLVAYGIHELMIFLGIH